MEGFFPLSQLVSKPAASLIPKCGSCGLYKTCKSPKMEPSGRGRQRILIVGEAPGADEDQQGKQFVGKTGRYLQRVLDSLGIDMRKDCWLTNALICRPPKNKIQKDVQIDYCRPNLTKTIQELNPETIILLGKPAVRSLLGSIWKEEVGGMTKWAGWAIPCPDPNAWICPTFHPSYIERFNNPVADLWFKRHLRSFFKKEGRPWDSKPNYESKIKRIFNPEEAAGQIRLYMSFGKPLAFDYETNMLKPDFKGAEIVSCSVSDGETAIAFPWAGEAIKQMGIFLKSRVPKIGANKKFEDRWTMKEFGFMVNKWIWDCMLGAHWRDARKGITGLKFQAFARLGVLSYEDHIKPFLKPKKGERLNRIKEIDINDLLLYNGLDSLLEHKVAYSQMKEGGLL